MKNIRVVLAAANLIGKADWYSGELYQDRAAAMSGNSRMTTRSPSRCAFDGLNVAPAGLVAAAVCDDARLSTLLVELVPVCVYNG